MQVDVLTGSDSYMLRPAVFQDDSVWQTSNETLRMAMRMDDVWISGHLARRGVKRKVRPGCALHQLNGQPQPMDPLNVGCPLPESVQRHKFR